MVTPSGKAPPITANAYGGVPPDAATLPVNGWPTVPEDGVSVPMVGGTGAALIVMRSCLVANWFAASVTRALKSKSPAAVGVPLTAPFAAKDKPGGKVPADTVQVYGD